MEGSTGVWGRGEVDRIRLRPGLLCVMGTVLLTCVSVTQDEDLCPSCNSRFPWRQVRYEVRTLHLPSDLAREQGPLHITGKGNEAQILQASSNLPPAQNVSPEKE